LFGNDLVGSGWLYEDGFFQKVDPNTPISSKTDYWVNVRRAGRTFFRVAR